MDLTDLKFLRDEPPQISAGGCCRTGCKRTDRFASRGSVAAAATCRHEKLPLEADAETADLFYFVISEVITLGVTALAIGTLNDKEYEIAAANMQLEAKAAATERSFGRGYSMQQMPLSSACRSERSKKRSAPARLHSACWL